MDKRRSKHQPKRATTQQVESNTNESDLTNIQSPEVKQNIKSPKDLEFVLKPIQEQSAEQHAEVDHVKNYDASQEIANRVNQLKEQEQQQQEEESKRVFQTNQKSKSKRHRVEEEESSPDADDELNNQELSSEQSASTANRKKRTVKISPSQQAIVTQLLNISENTRFLIKNKHAPSTQTNLDSQKDVINANIEGQNTNLSGSSDDEDQAELVNDSEDDQDNGEGEGDADGDPDGDQDQDQSGAELVDEENSDIFDTDSSDDQDETVPGSQVNELLAIENLVSDEPPKIESNEENKEQKEEIKEEMGGTLVYDSYCRLKGCDKIEQYFNENPPQKVSTDILFSKAESKEVSREIFADKARERDFGCDQDKKFFMNLPRFQTQRDFSNLQNSLLIPNIQNVLIFDSRFENGNLRKAAKVSNIEYNLWLENDLNTKGHTQWYYFKVAYRGITLASEKKTHRIKFNILNLAKTSSLYQVGMKPCIWSKNKNEKDGTGWYRGGDNISYKMNEIPRFENEVAPPKQVKGQLNNNNAFLLNNNGAGEGIDFYYTFSFTYEFNAHEDDEVYFAHAIPYTYTRMQETLSEIRKDEKNIPILKMNILCYSLAKSPVPLLTITENVDTYLDYYEEMRLMHQVPNVVKKQFRQKFQKAKKLARQGEDSKGRVKRLLEDAFEEEIKQFFEYNEDHFLTTSPTFAGFGNRLNQYLKDHGNKKAIIITSRVHPGEPQASHMLDGLINYLLSKEADQLRKHFVIRIVPMLNPDGVIYGNYRCSLLGCDLNRKWEKPNRLLHPTIFHSKQLIRHMHGERKVVLYCDLHGHSRKQNAFFYGCTYKNYEQEGRIKNAQLRIIPLLCCQRNNLFSLKDCRFNVEKCKESTARVVIFKEMNIMNSFTLECSFFGKECGNNTASTSNMAQLMHKDYDDPPKKRKLMHFTINEYNSLGETLMTVMHNYLPSEQSKLQFISGKILDVFYDEFIKFIPPYILKREEEKRKKLENAPNQKGLNSSLAVKNQKLKGQQNLMKSMGDQRTMQNRDGSVSNFNKRDNNTSMLKKNGQSGRGRMSAKAGSRSIANKYKGNNISINDYDRNADRTAAAYANLGEESSDQKVVHGLSGKDEEDTDHFGTIMNIPHNQNDIMEFEFFMNGIQSKLKEKEERKKKKLKQLLGAHKMANDEILMQEIAEMHTHQLDLLMSDSSSSGSSGDDETFQSRQQRRAKALQKQKQIQKLMQRVKENTKKAEAERVKQAEKDKDKEKEAAGKSSPRDASKSPMVRKPKKKKKKLQGGQAGDNEIQQAYRREKLVVEPNIHLYVLDKKQQQPLQQIIQSPDDQTNLVQKAPIHQISVGMSVFSPNVEEMKEQNANSTNTIKHYKKKLPMANVKFTEYGKSNFASLNNIGEDDNKNLFQNDALKGYQSVQKGNSHIYQNEQQDQFENQTLISRGLNQIKKSQHIRTKSKQGQRNQLLKDNNGGDATGQFRSRNQSFSQQSQRSKTRGEFQLRQNEAINVDFSQMVKQQNQVIANAAAKSLNYYNQPINIILQQQILDQNKLLQNNSYVIGKDSTRIHNRTLQRAPHQQHRHLTEFRQQELIESSSQRYMRVAETAKKDSERNPFKNEMLKDSVASHSASKPQHFDSVNQLIKLQDGPSIHPKRFNHQVRTEKQSWNERALTQFQQNGGDESPDNSPSQLMSIAGSIRLKSQKDFIISGNHTNKKTLQHVPPKSDLGWKNNSTVQKGIGSEFRKSLQAQDSGKEQIQNSMGSKQYLKSQYHQPSKASDLTSFHLNVGDNERMSILEPLGPVNQVHKSIQSPKRRLVAANEGLMLNQQAYFIPGAEKLGEFYPKNQMQISDQICNNTNSLQQNGIQVNSNTNQLGVPVFNRLKSSSHLGNINVHKSKQIKQSDLMQQIQVQQPINKNGTIMQGVSITQTFQNNPINVVNQPQIVTQFGRPRADQIPPEVRRKINEELVIMGKQKEGKSNAVQSSVLLSQNNIQHRANRRR